MSNNNYTHFAVNKNTNLIVNGWDYSGYDGSELRTFKRDYFFDDLIDNDFNPKDFKILTKQACLRQGINPDDMTNCWSNRGEVPLGQENALKQQVSESINRLINEVSAAFAYDAANAAYKKAREGFGKYDNYDEIPHDSEHGRRFAQAEKFLRYGKNKLTNGQEDVGIYYIGDQIALKNYKTGEFLTKPCNSIAELEQEMNKSSLTESIARTIVESFGEPETRETLIYPETLSSTEASEIAEQDGFNEEWEGAKAWFEGVVESDADFEPGKMPKYRKFICKIDYIDGDLYYDYGADYYFCVKTEDKINENIIDMKRTIRLTESELHKVIKESVSKILKEWTSPQFEMNIDGKYQVPSKYGMYIVVINGCKNGRPVIDIQQNRRDGSRSNTTIKPDTYYHTLFIERFSKYYQQTQDVQETLNMVIPSLG